ncbi:MAG: PIN domain-containing protein [Candidatus Promineifilaceae bacterium]
MAVIFDSSFLFALTYSKAKRHEDCVQLARSLREKFIIPVTVLPEVTYLLANRFGHYYMREFVSKVSKSEWHLENLSGEDLERASELLSVYADARLDFADATIIAMAERLGVETILTLDRRDFRMIRPKHIPYFNLLP